MIERPQGCLPPPYVLYLSRRVWNLRARLERGENVASDLEVALAEVKAFRCRDV
jgi:hypothetical protein